MAGIPEERTPEQVLIIAEAGVNHNGSLKIAKQLVDVAADSGVDVVKFQTFDSQELVTQWSPTASYQKSSQSPGTSQLEMLDALQLSRNEFISLAKYSNKKNIEFLSTAFDKKNMDFLMTLGIKRLKIPSGELTNLEFLQHIGSKGLPVILSTGMSDLEEVKTAVVTLLEAGLSKERLTILHCTSAYPAPIKDINLRAMNTLSLELKLPVGYSDHTLGTEISVAAVSMGASVIEKHFTLSRHMLGPDHAASMEPSELNQLVSQIRNIEIALGNGVKRCMPSELEVRAVARRSLVAARRIEKGEKFSKEMLVSKRPGTGMSPMDLPNIIGRVAERDFLRDELIE
jgi:N,N'-diacetyllegionaminate synthase